MRAAISSLAVFLLALAPLLLLLTSPGCTNSTLAAARRSIEAHHYAEAHHTLLGALKEPDKLTPGVQREAKDDLCLTEVEIGPPPYPLEEQRIRCADAAAEPGSQSGPLLDQVDARIRSARSREVDRALAMEDVAGAMTAAFSYEAVSGASPDQIAQWRRRMLATLEAQDQAAARRHRRQINLAIAKLGRRYPRVRKLDRDAFERWIATNATVSGAPLLSAVAIHAGAAEVAVTSQVLPTMRLNLAKLAEINNAVTARCRCAGRTDVMLVDTGLPAYFVRVSPVTGSSEILILPQP